MDLYNIVAKGLCSDETIKRIATYDCFASFLSEQRLISRGVLQLIFGICEATKILAQFETLRPRLNPLNDINVFSLQQIGGPPINLTVTSSLDYENTRHRYPWICSLRDQDRNFHYCSATLLSKPPKPTVLVTSAHCTFICKSEKV